MLGHLTMANMRLNIMSGWPFDGTMLMIPGTMHSGKDLYIAISLKNKHVDMAASSIPYGPRMFGKGVSLSLSCTNAMNHPKSL
jgi:hypothetical protein